MVKYAIFKFISKQNFFVYFNASSHTFYSVYNHEAMLV